MKTVYDVYKFNPVTSKKTCMRNTIFGLIIFTAGIITSLTWNRFLPDMGDNAKCVKEARIPLEYVTPRGVIWTCASPEQFISHYCNENKGHLFVNEDMKVYCVPQEMEQTKKVK